ncbi:hypothetical protein F8568_011935 [Actinomadura sp. LD22]|uniref:Uncharacterized protein n=1 Tax=Actinomadura physcomitrii TaxID=2650748 RepID=A0A6I4M9H0_9ACTN|nr:hypothetical protein [Actinomadura physcomitrii]MWA01075.1 hypothetical protein [Actinomadura physcomitrii]
MSSILGAAKVAQGRFSFYVSLQLTSVLAPGVCVVAEVAFFASRTADAKIVKNLGHSTVLVSLIVALAVIAIGYVVGYVCRELGFKVVSLLERLPPFRLRDDSATALAQLVGPVRYGEFLETHPYLAALEEEDRRLGERRWIGGYHRDSLTYERFVYAKAWLKNHAAGFSVDSTESEINILTATLVPIGFGAVDLTVVTAPQAWLIVLAALLAVVLWAVVLSSVLRLRRSERWESLRNLLLDHSMRRAIAEYAPPPESARGGPPA